MCPKFDNRGRKAYVVALSQVRFKKRTESINQCKRFDLPDNVLDINELLPSNLNRISLKVLWGFKIGPGGLRAPWVLA